MAASQLHKVDNQPLATRRISRLVMVTLPFRENRVQSPSGRCLSMGMLERAGPALALGKLGISLGPPIFRGPPISKKNNLKLN